MALHSIAKRVLLAASVGLLFTVGTERVRANAPAPASFRELERDPTAKAGDKTTFVVRRDDSQAVSRVRIPRKFLPDGYKGDKTRSFSSDGVPRKTVNAGALLATVISGGGLAVVFVRRRKIAAAVTTSVLMLAVTVAIGTAMASPPAPNPTPSVSPTASIPPQAIVEVVETGDTILLILGKDSPTIPDAQGLR